MSRPRWRGSKLSTIRNGHPAAPSGLQCSLAHWAYFALFRPQGARFVRPPPLPHPQFAMVAPLRSQARLRLSLAYWAYYGLLPPLAAAFVRPLQFPLKSCGFSGAETARKRFSLWKMGFSGAKIAPSPPDTPPGTIKARKGFALLFVFSTASGAEWLAIQPRKAWAIISLPPWPFPPNRRTPWRRSRPNRPAFCG